MEVNEITEKVLFCAFRVHSELGPGLLEKAYEDCLRYELNLQGLNVEPQKILPIRYRDAFIETGYRLDLLVEGRVVVEIKSVESFKDVHFAQVLTYLRLSECKIGLLLNFNVKSLKNGIKRIAL
jgi:GxxExxY protein